MNYGEYKDATVLIADDSPNVRAILRIILKGLGFTICEAIDGVEAFYLVKMKAVDLIISDWNMPRMSGLEFLRKVKADQMTCDIPFLMLTGEYDEDHVLKAISEEVDDYLIKPFTVNSLCQKVARIMSLTPQVAQ